TQWGARPIFGSLGAYPMSRVVGATMASSAGTSVSPAWPTGTTAGHRGLLWVATTGTLPTISGWSLTAQTISGLQLGSYHRMLQEGDTAPTITVGGGGTVSAVLITEDTPHPRWNEVPFMNSSSTPSVV